MALPVDAPADVSDAMADRLEHHVRRLGIPLSALEDVVASLETAERFLAACEDGDGRACAARLQGREPSTKESDDPTARVRVTTDPPGLRRPRRGTGSTSARQA